MLSLSGVVFAITFTYYIQRFKRVAFSDATGMVDAFVRENAYKITAEFNTDIGVCRSLSNTIASLQPYHTEEKWPVYIDLLKEIDTKSVGYLNGGPVLNCMLLRKVICQLMAAMY